MKTRNNMIDEITGQGYTITYNPPGDGNCQFLALCHSLLNFGVFHSPKTLRQEIVEYIRNHENINNLLIREFLEIPWDRYITEMDTERMYGDEITFRVFANIFDIELNIISILGNEGFVSILPEDSQPYGRIILGHFA